jgi:hypothetical protein
MHPLRRPRAESASSSMRPSFIPSAWLRLALAASLLVPLPAQAGLLDLLFGRSPPARGPVYAPLPSFEPGEAPRPSGSRRSTGAGGGSRSVCVRMCDGYYYPLDSVATRSGSGQGDCEQSCPGVAMGVFRVSGDSVGEARDFTGRRYSDLPNAFSYRSSVTPACSCHTASARPVTADMTLRTGDIVVTSDGAVVFRGSDRDLHRPQDFEDIRTSRALKGSAFALADRVLGFSFQESQARKAAVQLAHRPSQDIVVTPLRTGSVSANARSEAQAVDTDAAAEAPPAARVVLPLAISVPN